MGADDGPPRIPFGSASEWESWLEQNHERAEGVWAMLAKKGSGIDSVGYPEVLDCALCFGWIDGRRESLDERYFLQRELGARPRAQAFFAGLSSQNRYAILYRLGDAKRPKTRARRLARFVAMLEAGESIYPQ